MQKSAAVYTGWILGSVSGIVFLTTLLSHIGWGDSGDLTLACVTVGVGHPSGYPLYTLLGHLFTRLPFGPSNAWKLGLFSALCAACVVGMFAWMTSRFTKSCQAGILSGLTLAFSLSFWQHAITIEVYALHTLFAISLVAILYAWQAKSPYLFAFIVGLSLTHHLTILLLFPGLMLWMVAVKCRFPLKAVFCLILPLLCYLYLPLANALNRPYLWGDLSSWRGILDHIQGKMYHHRLARFDLADIGSHFFLYLKDLSIQITWPGIVMAGIGFVRLFRDSWKTFFLLTCLFLPPLIYALSYDIDDIEAYYLIPNLVILFAMASGLTFHFKKPLLRLSCFAILLMLPAYLFIRNGVLLEGLDETARFYGEEVIEEAPKDALILVNGDGATFVLWYYAMLEHPRFDLNIVNLNLLTFDWYERQVKKRIPHLQIPERTDDFDAFVNALIRLNIEPFHIFASGVFQNRAWPVLLSTDFSAKPFGHLWEIHPVSRYASPIPSRVESYRLGDLPDAGIGKLRRHFLPNDPVAISIRWNQKDLYDIRFQWITPDGHIAYAKTIEQTQTFRTTETLPAGITAQQNGLWRIEVYVNGALEANVPFRVLTIPNHPPGRR